MIFSGIGIQNKDHINHHFTVIVPETTNEIHEALSQPLPTYIDAFVYMPGDIPLSLSLLKNIPHENFDWFFIDIHNVVFRMNKNVPQNKKIYLSPRTYIIVVLHTGMIEKYNLGIGDIVVYTPNKKVHFGYVT